MQVKGYVERIIYSNSENGHTILEIQLSDNEVKRLQEEAEYEADEITDALVCTGVLYLIHPGEYVVFNGSFVMHPSYGLQFKVTSYEESKPDDTDSIERYLGSGAIKGIGPALAARIVRRFKEDTFKIIEERPEELAGIKGISRRMAMEIADQVAEKRDMRRAMLFLAPLGIGMNLAVKIYKEYGESLYEIIKDNPYKLADDIDGVGFKIADEIARNSGVEMDSPFRVKSGIYYTLMQAVANGHTYLPMEGLLNRTEEMLCVEIKERENLLMDMIIARKITVRNIDGVEAVYPASLYNTEISVANRLVGLDEKYNIDERRVLSELGIIEQEENIDLDELQKNAVIAAARNGVLVVTGGPGTGKTTTINAMIKYFENQGCEIRLAAPTGRAAKRMTETTGYDAQTIHRLLELSGVLSEDSTGAVFERNELNPLEADVVIIDEMSMVDIFLMNHLIKAISRGTRLIMVGDANQLPSVGPGNVLKDIIESERIDVVKLTKIFRQEAAGDIVVNAHKINKGEPVQIGPSSKEFPFIKRGDANAIINATVTLIRDKLPNYTNSGMNDIQVLTPTRKGNIGVERLNQVLQNYLNPQANNKVEKNLNGVIFREGDKVMQIKNNYKIPWEIRGKRGIVVDEGMGVFNGDVGIIDNINLFSNELTVRFEDDKFVVYSFKEVDELEHAYAVTVHKSQGSEYPAVVLPLLDGPRMLMNRNILYTAVTRAKKCMCIVESEETFAEMVANEKEQKRYSSLARRIREVDLSE